jgi:hypothetical protein
MYNSGVTSGPLSNNIREWKRYDVIDNQPNITMTAASGS